MVSVRRDLPSGTVTFLFTDVEGSTKLLHELGAEKYAEALAEHRRVLREAFAAHGGVEVDTQGDAFFVAFPTAPGALQAAAEALAGLAAGLIRMRMGVHTGTPHVAEEGYVGVDVNRAARIAACGHGGQVLVSASTTALLGTDGLRDLGEHRLKDLSAPERIYQLGDDDFPPLKSLHQTNLPIPTTAFLGREQELAQVLGLLSQDDVRMLTLTGPGGTGKTRLGLQAAGGLAERYPHGVWWVPLAALRDSELVLEAAGQALGAKDGVAEHVGDRSLLLLFDNFEHVVEAAADLAALLASCPKLDLLVTSREPLHVTGEQEYPVPPLAHEEGVGFFLARARAIRPDFEPDDAVSEICRRLDDLPLALELAAARVKALSSVQILERLEQRLPLLTGGARDLPERQRTLRATIAWSYELLRPEEQGLFGRLAVFRGGCTLEACEEVAEADLDTLQSLVDKSLLRHTEDRFQMLETIREYAAERLKQSGEAEELRRRHAELFLRLAEEAEPHMWRAEQGVWLARLEADHDNLRSALAWARDGAHRETELRLAISLEAFWEAHGYISEGRRWLEGALAGSEGLPARLRAHALFGEARLVGIAQDDPVREIPILEESLALFRETGDTKGAILCLSHLGGAVTAVGEARRGRELSEESVALARASGDTWTTALALNNMGDMLMEQGDYASARHLLEESLALRRALGEKRGISLTAANLAELELLQGAVDQATHLVEEALELARELGHVQYVAKDLHLLGLIALEGGRHDRAAELFKTGLNLCLEIGNMRLAAAYLAGIGGVAAGRGAPLAAARLWGAAKALHDEHSTAPFPVEKISYHHLRAVRASVGEAVYASAVAEGQAMGLERAIDHATASYS